MDAQQKFKLHKAQTANRVKLKLKTLLKQIDVEASGEVKTDVFFQLLELHSIKLTQQELKGLKKGFSKNGG